MPSYAHTTKRFSPHIHWAGTQTTRPFPQGKETETWRGKEHRQRRSGMVTGAPSLLTPPGHCQANVWGTRCAQGPACLHSPFNASAVKDRLRPGSQGPPQGQPNLCPWNPSSPHFPMHIKISHISLFPASIPFLKV